MVICLNNSRNVSVQRCVLYLQKRVMIGSVNELWSSDVERHWLEKPHTNIHTSPFYRPGADVDSQETDVYAPLLENI